MRRKPAVEVPPTEADPQYEALTEVTTVLTPLRELRKQGLERRCRKAKQQREELRAAVEHAQAACAEDLHLQQEERRALAKQCEGQVMSLTDLLQWQQRERDLIDQQETMRAQVQRMEQDLKTLTLHFEQLQDELHASERALEKLACLREILA